jgi:NADH-quinone oxidoreductase subunit A
VPAPVRRAWARRSIPGEDCADGRIRQALACVDRWPALTVAALQHGHAARVSRPIASAVARGGSVGRTRRRAAEGSGMDELLVSYLPIVIFIGVALVVGLALLAAPFLIAYKNPDPEKLSAYECGFNAFDDARMKFDIRFYLVSILFIIFDLEVAFLFPWAVSFGEIGMLGFWSMMIFLGVLTIGFIYEWKKGALEWD